MRISKSAPFKYTFPIAKAEKRADGLYIVGFASGPEIDLENERMDPEAITRFSEQINTADTKLVYRDAHAEDGVMRDLGEITKAWINEHFHLGVEVKLDEANPASLYLFRQITEKGKQYGMSVAGRVEDYVDEFVAEAGSVVRTYKNVLLDEISNTTRPAWYPSFGTVLSKSIKDASIDAPMGVNVENDELLDAAVEETSKSDVEATASDETTEKSVETTEEVAKSSDAANDASSAAYIEASLIALLGGEAGEADDEAPLRVALAAIQQFIAQETAEIGTPEDTDESYAMFSTGDKEMADEIAKAGRKLSGATSAKLRELHDTITSTLAELGAIETETETETTSEKAASSDGEDTVEKTDGGEATAETIDKSALDALALDLQKANERIAELEAMPRTQLPGVITDETKKAEDILVETLAKASPRERLQIALALQTKGQ